MYREVIGPKLQKILADVEGVPLTDLIKMDDTVAICKHNVSTALRLYSEACELNDPAKMLATYELVDEANKKLERVTREALAQQRHFANQPLDIFRVCSLLTVALHKRLDALPNGRRIAKDIVEEFQNQVLKDDQGTSITPDAQVLDMDDTVPGVPEAIESRKAITNGNGHI